MNVSTHFFGKFLCHHRTTINLDVHDQIGRAIVALIIIVLSIGIVEISISSEIPRQRV